MRLPLLNLAVDNCPGLWNNLLVSILGANTRKHPIGHYPTTGYPIDIEISGVPRSRGKRRDAQRGSDRSDLPAGFGFRRPGFLIGSRYDLEFRLEADDERESETDSVDNDLAFLNARRDEEDVPPVMDVPDEFSWGYDVHRRWVIASTHSNPNNLPLATFKLLLDDSSYTYESENAAEFAGSPEIKCGQHFTLVDAGGGTVDVVTCRVIREEPVRLDYEVVPANGSLDGSSYINEDFRAWLLNKLDDEKYLEEYYGSLEALVEILTSEHFEPRIKRNLDICSERPQRIEIPIPGLQEDHNLGFQRGHLVVPVSVIRSFFFKRLDGIWALVESQLDQAAAKAIAVETIILIGGFGTSVSLQKHLKAKLREYAKRNNCHVKLLLPDERNRASIPTAVSSGGVYRACNKANGPKRIAQSSYGLLRSEPFMAHPDHRFKKKTWSPHDGTAYLTDTIYWFLERLTFPYSGENVPSVWEYELDSVHLLDELPGPLICREELNVSDTATKSHYKKSDKTNKGAERAGAIEVDVSFLRDQGQITPEEAPTDRAGHTIGARHYKIELKIRIRVIGRDLECTAIYKDLIEQKCQINIAPAFRPGVE
ncbi:Hsp70 family heat shock protein [Fusarium sp. NRRL 52700]|nr:Hsp70 family heat shock protein [Fusarium sp. NRRL 52700]